MRRSGPPFVSNEAFERHASAFVPNSYRWPAPGRRIVVDVTPFGVEVLEGTYDRKRANGNGPDVMVRAMRPGMIDGTPVWF